MTTIAECPAYKIIEPTRHHSWSNLPVFKYREIVAIDSGMGYWNFYRFGSVASYAIKSGDDPIAAVERAIDNGHALHWLNRAPTVLSNMRGRQKTHVGMKWGDEVFFEGRRFRIEPVPNHNAKLVEVRA